MTGVQTCALPILLYEAPHKLNSTLKDLSVITKNRRIVLARELTKIHEEFIVGTSKELLERMQEPRGEFVIVIEKNTEPKENIFETMTLEEHYKYYETLRNGEKRNKKANCKR